MLSDTAAENKKIPGNITFPGQTVDKVALEFTFQSNFSFMKRLLSKIEFLGVFLSSSSPHLALIFAN